MSNVTTEIQNAVESNNVRAIETALNGLGVSADVLGRGTDEERLLIPAYGEVYFDGRMEECPGYVVRSIGPNGGLDDCDDAVEPDELVRDLVGVVEMAQAIA